MVAQAKKQFRQAFLSFTLLCLCAVVQAWAVEESQKKNSSGVARTAAQTSDRTISNTIPSEVPPQQIGQYSVSDLDGNGEIDTGDISLLLLKLSGLTTDTGDISLSLLNMSSEINDSPDTTVIDIADTTNTFSLAASAAGVQGLHAKNYLLDISGNAASGNNAHYSVMDVYVKFNSAVGVGSAGERVVSFFGQATTDTATFGVNKSAKYVNSANLAFQHSNTSWMPSTSANGGTGNNTWDSYVGVGNRTQGAGNTLGVTPDIYFTNPNANVAQIVGGSSGQIFVGGGWYQTNPTDTGFETNASAYADKLIMIGRFTLKISDILASSDPNNVKMIVWGNTTGKTTAQTGGTTLYTVSSINLKSDAQTKYTTQGKTWIFDSTFEGNPGQTPWTFATNNVSVPSNLVASSGLYGDRIDLQWTTISNATGYEVWRSDTGESSTYNQIASVNTNTGSYSDTTPQSNITYHYKVRAVDGTLFSNVATGFTSIPAPTAVAASDGTFTDKVQVSWNEVSGAGSYDIFRDGLDKVSSVVVTNGGTGYSFANVNFNGGGGTGAAASAVVSGGAVISINITNKGSNYTSNPTITFSGPSSASGAQATASLSIGSATAPATTFNDISAIPGTSSTYFVKAVKDGVSSGTNGSDTGFRALATPAPPTASAGAFTDAIKVEWAAVVGATGYNIYRDNDILTPVGSTTTLLSFNDTNAPIANTHTYRIKATSAVTAGPLSGNSNVSWVGMASPALGSVKATYGTYADKVVVSWAAVPGALEYKIYRGGTVGNGITIGIVPASELSFNDTTVAVASAFTYNVAASNAQGFGPAMSSAVSAGIRNISPPPNVAASRDIEDKIEITWDSAPGATGYNIYRNDSAVRIGSTSENGATTFSDFSAASATNYSYFVRATNGGKSLISDPSPSVDGLRGTSVPTPSITSVNPNTGVLAGGTLITITGTNLTSASAVTIGGVSATSVTVLSPTQITAITPNSTAGTKAVAVSTPGGSASLAGAFTYTNTTSLPTITSVHPTSGTTAGGTPITIMGTNLTGASVTVGSSAVTFATVTDTQITALTPGGAAGVANIVATNTAGAATTNTFSYVAPPTITSVNPNFSFLAGGGTTTITGTNLLGASVSINGTIATITNRSATEITFVTPAGSAGARTLLLDTEVGSASSIYTYINPPTISGISPESGPSDIATQITITGTNLTGATGVTIGGNSATDFVLVSATKILAKVPIGLSGEKDVIVAIPTGPATLNAGYTYYSPVAPTISSVSPSFGPISGGTSLTLSGTKFTGATQVTIGGVECTSVVVVSATSINAISPAGTGQNKDVTVTTPSGSATKLAGFDYIDTSLPTLISVSPNSGPLAGATAITITGTNLLGASSVTVGGVAATNVNVVSATSITAVTPAGTVGAKDLVVTLTGTNLTKSGAFTYKEPAIPAPTISNVSPVSGPVSGGTSITITGTNFTGATGVTVGGVAATSVNVASATSITALTPAGTEGAQTVEVTTPGGSASKSLGFTYNTSLPTLAEISPNSGPTAGGASITMSGTNLADVISVTIGGYECTSVVAAATQVTAQTPANSAGAKTVVLTTSGGLSLSAAVAYTYFSVPAISTVTPFTGGTSGGTLVAIAGTNLTGTTSVTFGDVAATSFTVVSTNSITAITPAASAGVVSIVVTTSGGIATKSSSYTYTDIAPAITNILPSEGSTNGGDSITITGVNLDGQVSVTIGGVDAQVLDNNSTSITCQSPNSTTPGAKDVVVTTPNGVVTKVAGFSYYTQSAIPTITSVSPTTGITFGGTPFTINGTLLAGTTGVTVGGVAATNVVAISATQVTAVSPAGEVGAKPVVVTTTNGTSTSSKTFTYTDFNLSPIFGPTAGGTAITITGSNFTNETEVTVGGNAVTNKILVSSTKIVAVTPQNNSIGDVNVVVTFPGLGSMTKTNGFKYFNTPPSITSIEPNFGKISGSTSFTIFGGNFGTVLTGTTVTVGGTAATISLINATSITAVTPIGTAGAKDVKVTANGVSTTVINGFTYFAPPIFASSNSVVPNTGPSIGGTVFTIAGTNLIGASSVKIGDSEATLVAVTDTLITAITPAQAASATAKNIVIVTPGGTVTKTAAFTYIAAPTITSVSPSSGPLAGGTSITITGTNLTGATGVTVGGVAATSVVVVNATSITALTPVGTAGSKDVVVNTPGGSATKIDAYTFIISAPTITSVSPSSGPTAGGTSITITGTNLNGATSVLVGDSIATITSKQASQIVALTPAGTVGLKNVVLNTSNGTVTKLNAFNYEASSAPTIASVSPSSGPAAGGTAITITGTNLTGATSVTVGGVAATSVNVASATSITALTPAGTAGAQAIVVTTVGGAATLSEGFTYFIPVPTIASLSPNSGTTLGGTPITITGANLTGASSVTFGGVAATSVVVVNATTITLITPSGAEGPQIVAVTTPGGTATLPDGFTYLTNAPTITGVTPSSGTFNGGTTITLTGTNFTDTSSVKVGGIAVTSFTVVNATTITAVTPAGSAGLQSVSVTTPISTATKSFAFTYVVPAPVGVAASDGASTSQVTVTWNAVAGAVTGYDIQRGGITIGSSVGTATTYADSTAVAGTLYSYAVVAQSATGFSVASAADNGWVKLSAPLNVQCSTNKVPQVVFTDKVQISWTATVGATSYDIFRNGGATKIGSSQGTTYDDTTATVGVNFTYTVRAVCALGLSDASAGAIGWRAPEAPTSVVASDGTSATKVTVTWVAAIGATGYDIFRDGGVTKIGSSVGIATTFTDTTALATTTHTYAVKTVTAAGSSVASASDTGYVVLATPLGLTATDGTSFANVGLSWSAVTGSTGYQITRSDSTSVLTTTSGNAATTFIDTTAIIGQIYSYSVVATATNPIFNSTAVIDDGYRAIEAPTAVSATDSLWTSKIFVSWNAVTGAVGYQVFRDGATTPIATISGGLNTSFTDSSTTVQTVYTYAVKAQGPDVLSAASQSDTGVRAIAASIVQGVSATDGTYIDKVVVTWTAAPHAIGYNIYRNGLAAPIGTVLGNSSVSYSDFTAKIGVNHNYNVRSFTIPLAQSVSDALGLSVISESDLGYREASAPLNVQATDGTLSDQVRVTWDALPTVLGYKIYRDGVEVGSTLLDTITTYSDSSAIINKVCTYTVKAVTAIGLSGASVGNTGFRGISPGPTNVAASDGTFSTKVVVTWSKLVGCTAYQIFRNGALVGTTTGYSAVTYNDTTAAVAVVYTYTVVGVVYGGLTQASLGNTGFRSASFTSDDDGASGSNSHGDSSGGATGIQQSAGGSVGHSDMHTDADSTNTVSQSDDAAGDTNDSADSPTSAQMLCDALFLDVSQRMELSSSFAAAIAPQLGVDDDFDGVMDICQRNQGDMNLDGAVNDSDLVDFMRAFEAHDNIADLNLDGELDGSDISLLLTALDTDAEQHTLVGESPIGVVVGEMDQVNASHAHGAIVGGSTTSERN